MEYLIPAEMVENKIYLIRGKKVMLDGELAKLYGVETFNLNKAVKRNIDRFPDDFMFQLEKKEIESLTFQIGMSNLPIGKEGRGGRRTHPFAFTEQGIAMLSSVLKSKRAIHMNILIMRAFVKINQVLATHKEVSRKLIELEQKVGKHDSQISVILDAIRKMIEPEDKPAKRIGFIVDQKKDK